MSAPLSCTAAMRLSSGCNGARPLACTAGCGFLQNAALNILVALVELDEACPLRLVGRDLRILDPVAAGILIEIHARIDALVDVVEAKAGRRLGGSGLTGSKSTKATHSHQKKKDR